MSTRPEGVNTIFKINFWQRIKTLLCVFIHKYYVCILNTYSWFLENNLMAVFLWIDRSYSSAVYGNKRDCFYPFQFLSFFICLFLQCWQYCWHCIHPVQLFLSRLHCLFILFGITFINHTVCCPFDHLNRVQVFRAMFITWLSGLNNSDFAPFMKKENNGSYPG